MDTYRARLVAAMRVAERMTLLRTDRSLMATHTVERKLSHGQDRLLKDWLVAEYGAVCAWCGDEYAAETLQRGHLIPASWCTPGERGKRRGGFLPGNIALTCEGCNKALGDEDADPYTMARPDCVPLAWPGMKVGKVDGRRVAQYA